jgi:ATPase subunit of ABC transporter with duplicated ATPase domains
VTPINVAVSQGEKVSLEGNNGCGKSTLLNVLRGSLALKAGECHINSTVYYLDQHFSLINNKISLLDNLIQTNRSLTTTDARTLLAGIGFRRDDVYRKAEVLSGGEKMKLAMLIVAHQPQPALLLLDEPDNHLDLESMILLSNTLSDYQGTFVVVSHDQDFIRGCGITKSVYL